MVVVMDQDMKSYSLDAGLGHKEFTSDPLGQPKEKSTQHVNICHPTKSAIAQEIVNVRVKAMLV